MSFLTVEEIVALRAQNERAPLYTYRTDGACHQYAPLPPGLLTPVDARAVIEAARNATLAQMNAKINRPWALVNLSEKLDPAQAWLGWELESGWETVTDYTKVVNYIFDETAHACIDREGQNPYPAEITFPPENYNNYAEGTAQIQKFYDWMEANNCRNSASRHATVGTHVNISTPAYRRGANESKISILNRSFFCMSEEGLTKCFGRTPYGVGYSRGAGGQRWIEFKVFRSTQDKARFAEYLSVAQNLAALVEKLWSMSNEEFAMKIAGHRYTVIWNIEDILLGKETEPEFKDAGPFSTSSSHDFTWGQRVRRVREVAIEAVRKEMEAKKAA